MNKTILIGNLTRDPELRTTANGTAVASFTLACNRNYKNAEGKYDTDFIPCIVWRERAEFVEKYFQKGSRMAVEGSIRTRNYEKDGQKRFGWEVVCDRVEFAGTKNTDGGAAKRDPGRSKGTDEDPFGDDVDKDFEPLADSDLPF